MASDFPTGKDITNVDIKPLFPEKLNSVSAYHDTPVGRISVNWEKLSESKLVLKIKSDKNLHGKIVLPNGYAFSDGVTEKTLDSGNFELLKA